MRNNLDNGVLHAMRAFIRVVDTGSFTLAAEQMALTTAQISRLIAALELRLHTKLLQRTTRRQVLTDAGQIYADRCRHILELVVEAEAEASGSAVVPNGVLHVQCMTNFGRRYVSPLIPGFCEKYPQVQMEYTTSQYIPNLLASGIDVSIYLADVLPDSGQVARRLGATFEVLCASRAYLDKHGYPEHPSDLDHHACLQLVNPSVLKDWILVNHEQEKYVYEAKGPLIADTPDVVLDAAERGAGIAMLPLFSVIASIQEGRLEHVLPMWRTPDIGVYVMYSSHRYLDGKTRAWLDYIDTIIPPSLKTDGAYFYRD